METLLLHEAVPGYHLQVARAQELKQLPAFRRSSWFTAYGEGWALYAESLGDEMGLKIKALRAKARAELGDKFDLRHFHNAVIDSGGLPLSVLEQLIDEWIAGEKAKAKAGE